MTSHTDNSADDYAALLVDLQSRLAFQDHTIAELNDVIADHQRQLDRLEQRVKLLADKLQHLEDSVATGGGKAPAHEKPPHY